MAVKVKIKVKAPSLDAANKMLSGDTVQVTRPAFKSPDSTFTEGSAGSQVEGDNASPAKENAVDAAPAVTDHPYASNPVIDNRIPHDSPEMIRRKNATARDKRTGWRITENRVYPD